jgi:hypothetical protein
MEVVNLNTSDFLQEGVNITLTQDENVIKIDATGQGGNGSLDFDFNYFDYVFTEPISYLLFKEGVDENTFASPIGYTIDMEDF